MVDSRVEHVAEEKGSEGAVEGQELVGLKADILVRWKGTKAKAWMDSVTARPSAGTPSSRVTCAVRATYLGAWAEAYTAR